MQAKLKFKSAVKRDANILADIRHRLISTM